MNPRALERQARLLLSWGEKARAAGNAPEQVREARVALDALRNAAGVHVQGLSRQLQRLLDAQAELIARVQDGAIAPARANRRNRRLAARLERLRDEASECRRIAAAGASEAVGGFIDAPLHRYRRMLRQPDYLRWSTMDPIDRRTLVACGVIVAVLVIGILAVRLGGRSATFESGLDPAIGALRLRCTNTTAFAVRLSFAPPGAPLPQAACRVSLIVNTPAGPREQPIAGSPPVMRQPPPEALDGGAIAIEPGLSEDALFDLARIRALYPDAVGVTLRCTAAGGRVLHEAAHPLSS